MHDREGADRLVARDQRHTDGSLWPALIRRVIGAPQPALIHARIWHKRGLAVPDYPAGHAPIQGFSQLPRRVFVEIRSKDDRCFDGSSYIIHHDDAGPFTPHILHGRKDQALQDGSQIQCAGNILVYPDQQFKQIAAAIAGHLDFDISPWSVYLDAENCS